MHSPIEIFSSPLNNLTHENLQFSWGFFAKKGGFHYGNKKFFFLLLSSENELLPKF